ncbi:hypothetical protein HPB49_010531 [Dermacentor silvarum]|uniref:Uncharacterized protein n=1 Tax=Dermacentor silvarum TaxID=543639 RepID=A0ACB8D4N8_DERSI|nr:hypothetical protein HPB49_010531 [Dermacentor silvarum]
MTSQGVTPGQKHQLICTSQPDCKRQDTGDSEDESTIIEDDNVANLSDLDMDEGGFRVVRHRKDRAEGIPVLITAASERADLRQVNPILLYSELEAILGGAPVKSRFTAQGALLLDVETEGQANILLETKNIGGIAISSRVPHSYMKNTCIVRGVPKWYSDEELLTFLRPQGVFHAKRIIRRVHTSSSEWESRRTNSVVLTFAPNSERPEKINLGFTRHELVDYVETPPRCFKCQRFGHIAKYCRGEQRCKRCGGPHDFKTCASKENSSMTKVARRAGAMLLAVLIEISLRILHAAKYITAALNKDYKPCDSFYDHVCSNWMFYNPIPDDKSTASVLEGIDDKLTEDLKGK